MELLGLVENTLVFGGRMGGKFSTCVICQSVPLAKLCGKAASVLSAVEKVTGSTDIHRLWNVFEKSTSQYHSVSSVAVMSPS